MTFLPELKRLMDAATTCGGEVNLESFLRHKAPAIAELVESVAQEHGGNHHEPECPICIALAKLNANDVNDVNDGGKHER